MRRPGGVAWGVVLGLALAACGFPGPSANTDDDSTDVTDDSSDSADDGVVPDAGPCQQLGSFCAGTFLRTCNEIGLEPDEEDCHWGCLETPEPRCGVLHPTGGGADETDTDPDDLDDNGDVTLEAGDIIDGDGDGMISGVNASEYEHDVAGPTQNIAVFRFNTLTINGDVTLRGSRSIVLVADGPIVVGGIISAIGACGADDAAAIPGPGGFRGGTESSAPGSGPGGAGGQTATSGGGGGGNGGMGGDGGNNTAGPTGGVPLGTVTIVELRGGGGGGAGGGGSNFGRGGGGGGAVQLISNASIEFTSGGINAGGCGGDGDSGGGADGGGGGGAGGTIVLEAPVIIGTGKLAVNGGGGGSGGQGSGDTGAPGALSVTPAAGQPPGGSAGGGGVGSAANSVNGGRGDDANGDAGGGGGAAGRIRILTRTGMVGFQGLMSPALGDMPTTATADAANVQ